MNRSSIAVALLLMFAGLCWAPASHAIIWADTWDGGGEWGRRMDHVFRNIADVRNRQKGSRGTGVYLQDRWILSSRHVIEDQNYGGPVASPERIKVRLPQLGGWYDVEEIVTHGGWDVVLLRLTEDPRDRGAVPERFRINAAFDEVGRLVEFGGFGRWGQHGGNIQGGVRFHRARNKIDSQSGGDFQMWLSTGENAVEYEGITSSGDSGGPIFMRVGREWVLCGVVRAGRSGNGASQYVRTSMVAGWIETHVERLVWNGDPPSVRNAAQEEAEAEAEGAQETEADAEETTEAPAEAE